MDLKNILGHPAVPHGGAIDGFLSFLFSFPHRDMTIAVITNAFPTPTIHSEAIARAVGSAALGAP